MTAAESQAFMSEYLKSPEVEYIEPNTIMHADFVPNDPYYGQYQWNLTSQPPGISIPQVWDRADGKGVIVAVVDTGSTVHTDLTGQFLPGYNFISDPASDRNRSGRSADASDPGDWTQAGDTCPSGAQYPVQDSSWHGTHVAGIIGALSNNGVGIAGVAPGAKLLPVRVLGRCGGTVADIADAVVWAAGGPVQGVPDNPNPAKVINMSLGGAGACSKTTQTAIDTARSKGATVVVSAGNAGVDASTQQPANCQGVIVVGATDANGNRASFSNYGSLVSVMAPGANILSTWNPGTTGPSSQTNYYRTMDGTSQAAPHVAGAIALMIQRDADNAAIMHMKPTLTPDSILDTFKPGWNGNGGLLLNVNALVQDQITD